MVLFLKVTCFLSICISFTLCTATQRLTFSPSSTGSSFSSSISSGSSASLWPTSTSSSASWPTRFVFLHGCRSSGSSSELASLASSLSEAGRFQLFVAFLVGPFFCFEFLELSPDFDLVAEALPHCVVEPFALALAMSRKRSQVGLESSCVSVSASIVLSFSTVCLMFV